MALRSSKSAPGAAVPATAGGTPVSNRVPGRSPPVNLDAEAGLLGCCVLDGGRETLTHCVEAGLTADAFFKRQHALLYQVLLELYKDGSGIDEIILGDRLQGRLLSSLPGYERDPEGQRTLLEAVGGPGVLAELTGRIESTVFAKHWLEIVKEKHLLRRLIGTATGVVERCYTQQDSLEHFIEEVEQEIFAISQQRVANTAKPLREAIDSAEKLIKLLLDRRGQMSGVTSGFRDLDGLTFGFQPGDMIVLAARPSMGKTALALNIAEHASLPKEGKPTRTLFFSLEMSAPSLAMRLLCSRARVSSERVREGTVNAEDKHRLVVAGKELKNAALLIDESSNLTILELRAKARRVHAQQPLGLVVIDYLQLISGTDNRVSREQQIAEISRGVKALAKELGVPVIVLSQLNRESEKEKRTPRLSDLRESGSIEQDADLVLLLYSKRDKDPGAEEGMPKPVEQRQLFVAKQRNGPVGEVPLSFVRAITRFENHASESS